MAVRRHDGRRGRPLDVLVEWEGEDSDGDMWEESWVSVSYLSADLRADARRLEAELFGPRAAQAGPASRRDTRRVAARQRQERERDVQPWRQAVLVQPQFMYWAMETWTLLASERAPTVPPAWHACCGICVKA